MNLLKKSVLGSAVGAMALATAVPATAQDYDHYRHRDNGAAVAVGAGVLGLAIGALVASGHHQRHYDRYDSQPYYPPSYRYDTGRWRNGDRYDNRYDYNQRGNDGYDRDGWHRNDGRRGDRNDNRGYRR